MSIPSEPIAARIDVQAMQDLLYDILATGLDAEQASVPIDTVERFLHEHARSVKSPEEFAAFFAQHGLTVSGRAPRPAALAALAALPPIQRPVQAEAPVLKFPVELASSAGSRDPLSFESAFPAAFAPVAPTAPAARTSKLHAYMTWATAAAALVALGAIGYVGYVGYATINNLEQRLDRTHVAAQADRQVIHALESHQVDLESNIAASAQIIERMDQKSDLILESIQPPAKKYGRR
jgi:hypothetical protein